MPAHDNIDTWNEQAPVFVGMTLTTDDSDGGDKTLDLGDEDTNKMDDHDFFDETDEINVILSALYQVSRAHTSSQAGAENWFEAVSVKFFIANIRHTF